jgi:hypothetical protein
VNTRSRHSSARPPTWAVLPAILRRQRTDSARGALTLTIGRLSDCGLICTVAMAGMPSALSDRRRPTMQSSSSKFISPALLKTCQECGPVPFKRSRQAAVNTPHSVKRSLMTTSAADSDPGPGGNSGNTSALWHLYRVYERNTRTLFRTRNRIPRCGSLRQCAAWFQLHGPFF